MKYAIVYTSLTGNTEQLAKVIKNKCGECYFGNPSDEALDADVIFIGFWATRNTCGDEIKAFIQKLNDKKVFIFGTAGYNNTQEHFNEIMNSVTAHIPSSNMIIGTYMCQGKVSESMQNKIKEVKPEMYEAIKDKLAESLSHPDAADLKALETKLVSCNL